MKLSNLTILRSILFDNYHSENFPLGIIFSA